MYVSLLDSCLIFFSLPVLLSSCFPYFSSFLFSTFLFFLYCSYIYRHCRASATSLPPLSQFPYSFLTLIRLPLLLPVLELRSFRVRPSVFYLLTMSISVLLRRSRGTTLGASLRWLIIPDVYWLRIIITFAIPRPVLGTISGYAGEVGRGWDPCSQCWNAHSIRALRSRGKLLEETCDIFYDVVAGLGCAHCSRGVLFFSCWRLESVLACC